MSKFEQKLAVFFFENVIGGFINPISNLENPLSSAQSLFPFPFWIQTIMVRVYEMTKKYVWDDQKTMFQEKQILLESWDQNNTDHVFFWNKYQEDRPNFKCVKADTYAPLTRK